MLKTAFSMFLSFAGNTDYFIFLYYTLYRRKKAILLIVLLGDGKSAS